MKEIPLNRGFVALVDDEDYEMVSRHKWSVLEIHGRCTVAQGVIDGKHWQLHRYILKPESRHIWVDHIDGWGLNCQRSNMRLADVKSNALNRHKYKNPKATSIYRGVYKAKNKWAARITLSGVSTRLGTFDTEREAAHAVDEATREHHGEWARYNLPREGEQSALR